MVGIGQLAESVISEVARAAEAARRRAPGLSPAQRPGHGAGCATATSLRSCSRAASPKAERRRHIRKYATGELDPDRSFFFRGPEQEAEPARPEPGSVRPDGRRRGRRDLDAPPARGRLLALVPGEHQGPRSGPRRRGDRAASSRCRRGSRASASVRPSRAATPRRRKGQWRLWAPECADPIVGRKGGGTHGNRTEQRRDTARATRRWSTPSTAFCVASSRRWRPTARRWRRSPTPRCGRSWK